MAIQTDIRVNGMVAILRRTRTDHKCHSCGLLIPAGEKCFVLTVGGSGLAGLKYPDYVHITCLGNELEG